MQVEIWKGSAEEETSLQKELIFWLQSDNIIFSAFSEGKKHIVGKKLPFEKLTGNNKPKK